EKSHQGQAGEGCAMLQARRVAGSLPARWAEMVRQTPVSNPQAATAGASPADLGRWLTRGLRPKGAPLPAPPEPPQAPASPPSEADLLAGWLTRGLTPKKSLRPSAPASRESLPPAASAPEPREPPALSPAVAPAPVMPFPPARDAHDAVLPFAPAEPPA